MEFSVKAETSAAIESVQCASRAIREFEGLAERLIVIDVCFRRLKFADALSFGRPPSVSFDRSTYGTVLVSIRESSWMGRLLNGFINGRS